MLCRLPLLPLPSSAPPQELPAVLGATVAPRSPLVLFILQSTYAAGNIRLHILPILLRTVVDADFGACRNVLDREKCKVVHMLVALVRLDSEVSGIRTAIVIDESHCCAEVLTVNVIAVLLAKPV